MYAKAARPGAGGTDAVRPPAGDHGAAPGGKPDGDRDDVVDADFEEVKE